MAEQPHAEVCDFLAGWEKDQKLVLLPRGSFKSTIATVAHSLWQMVNNPNIRILIISENSMNAKKYLAEIKDHIEKNELFIALYGNLKPADDGFWRQDEMVISTRTKIGGKEPTISTAGIGQTRVGMHYDLIVMDDVVSQNNTMTMEQIDKTLNFYRLMLSILDPGERMIIIGTRYHYADLYGHIINEEPENFDIIVRKAIQEDGSLLFPSRLTHEYLDKMKKAQGTYVFSCNPGYAPILMSDFTTKGLSDVRVGDKVVGFNLGDKHMRSRIVESIVEEVNSREADIVAVRLKSGRTIFCTEDHQWYTGRSEGSEHRSYLPAKEGRALRRVIDATYTPKGIKEIAAWSYLAGMIDGEGSCKNGQFAIHQSEIHHPEICNKIRDVLRALNIEWSEYKDDRKTSIAFHLKGGRELKQKLIEWGDPAKKAELVQSIFEYSSRICIEKDPVVSITSHGRERVYALKTTTGNYVAWGYASKNCQYQNEPVDSEHAVFKAEWVRYWKRLPQALRYFLSIDPAASVDSSADYTGFVVAGIGVAGDIFVVEAIQERITVGDILDRTFELVERYGIHKDGTVAFEMNAMQKTFKWIFAEEMNKRKFYFPISEMKPGATQSKLKRIKALQPYFEHGRVFIHKNHLALQDQILRFPKTRHDDLIDALASIIEVMYPADEVKVDKIDMSPITDNEKSVWRGVEKAFRTVNRKKRTGRC